MFQISDNILFTNNLKLIHMKNLKVLLCVVFSISTLFVTAQSADKQYNVAIEKALNGLDSAKSVQDMQKIRNQFERISNKYTKEWLPLYYVIYCDLQMVYYNPKGEINHSILDDAGKRLTQLEKMEDADKSELNTLQGYYYNALIMLDPQVNGQKYFNDVTSNYKNAINQNNKNPRPVFLLAFFEQRLPDFLKSDAVFCEELKKAENLFVEEKKSIHKPYWGKDFLGYLLKQCK